MAEMPEGGRLTKFLGRHLAALCLTYRHKLDDAAAPLRLDCTSGTFISIRDMTFFMTAGHAVKDIGDLVANPEYEVVSCVIADVFGLKVVTSHCVRLDLKQTIHFHIDEDGLDFGIFLLHQNQVRNLAAHEMVAVHEDAWKGQDDAGLNAYFVFGLPREWVPRHVDSDGFSLRPFFLPLEPQSIAPAAFEAGTYPRIFGKIVHELPLESLAGMSGGPVFGFNLEAPGKYWVVGIQSSWFKTSGVVTICPIPIIGKLLTEKVDEAKAALER